MLHFAVVLSATSEGISIISSFVSVIGALVEIASASFTLVFSLTTEIMKEVLQITRNEKKKHNKILMLAKSIETLICQALTLIWVGFLGVRFEVWGAG